MLVVRGFGGDVAGLISRGLGLFIASPADETPASTLRAFLQASFSALPYFEMYGESFSAPPTNGFWAFGVVGGFENQSSFGAPGANLYRTQATALVHIFTPAGRGPEAAEAFAGDIKEILNGVAIIPETDAFGPIRIVEVSDPDLGEGSTDGRFFRATIAFDYWYDISQ